MGHRSRELAHMVMAGITQLRTQVFDHPCNLGSAVLRHEDVPAGEVHVDDALAGEVFHAPGSVDGPRQEVAEGEGLLVEAVVGEDHRGSGGFAVPGR